MNDTKANQTQKEEQLSIGKASEYLGVSIDTLRRWVKKGKLKSSRSPGGHRYFVKTDLDKVFGKKYQRTQKDAKKEIGTERESRSKPITEPAVQPDSPPGHRSSGLTTPAPSEPTSPPPSPAPPAEPVTTQPQPEVDIPPTEFIQVPPEPTQAEPVASPPEPMADQGPLGPVAQPPPSPGPEPAATFRDAKAEPETIVQTVPAPPEPEPAPYRVETVETTEQEVPSEVSPPPDEPVTTESPPPAEPETSRPIIEPKEKAPIAVEPIITATDKKNGKLHKTASFLLILFITVNLVLLAIYIYLSRFA